MLWRSGGGRWYVLAAGSREVASIAVTGGARGRSHGPLLSALADGRRRAELDARLRDGGHLHGLR